MFLEIVAGLLGSQLIRTAAFDVATTLLCQIIQHTVTTVAKPRAETPAGQAEAGARGTEAGASQTSAPPAAAPSPAPSETTAPRLRALPKAEIVSLVPGRVRLRVPGLRDDAACAARITATVRTLGGVTAARANPLTGTLLVHFDPDQISVAAILAALASSGVPRPRAAEVPYLRLVVG